MGVILSGILGGFSGKVGPVIGGSWKGIDYMKQYFKPSNPQSVAQTAQRTKFKTVSLLASSLLGSLIATFRNPFAIKMSGYNYFIKDVIKSATSTGLATENCLVVNGTLQKMSSVSADYTNLTGSLDVNYSPTPEGNQLATDNVSVITINKTDNSILAYGTNLSSLADGSATIALPTGLTASDILAFCWLSRGSGSDFVVSDSVGVISGAI